MLEVEATIASVEANTKENMGSFEHKKNVQRLHKETTALVA